MRFKEETVFAIAVFASITFFICLGIQIEDICILGLIQHDSKHLRYKGQEYVVIETAPEIPAPTPQQAQQVPKIYWQYKQLKKWEYYSEMDQVPYQDFKDYLIREQIN